MSVTGGYTRNKTRGEKVISYSSSLKSSSLSLFWSDETSIIFTQSSRVQEANKFLSCDKVTF